MKTKTEDNGNYGLSELSLFQWYLFLVIILYSQQSRLFTCVFETILFQWIAFIADIDCLIAIGIS